MMTNSIINELNNLQVGCTCKQPHATTQYAEAFMCAPSTWQGQTACQTSAS